jgi:hypothetical protein
MIYIRFFGIKFVLLVQGNPLHVFCGVRNIHHEEDKFGIELWTGRGNSKRERDRIFRRQNSELEMDSG